MIVKCGSEWGLGARWVSESDVVAVKSSPELPPIWGRLEGFLTSGLVWPNLVSRDGGLEVPGWGQFGESPWRCPKWVWTG